MTDRPAKSLVLPIAVIVTGLLSLGQLFGVRGTAFAIVVSVLGLAWPFDNHTGSVFLLVVLLLIVLGVIALLIALLAIASGAGG